MDSYLYSYPAQSGERTRIYARVTTRADHGPCAYRTADVFPVYYICTYVSSKTLSSWAPLRQSVSVMVMFMFNRWPDSGTAAPAAAMSSFQASADAVAMGTCPSTNAGDDRPHLGLRRLSKASRAESGRERGIRFTTVRSVSDNNNSDMIGLPDSSLKY